MADGTPFTLTPDETDRLRALDLRRGSLNARELDEFGILRLRLLIGDVMLFGQACLGAIADSARPDHEAKRDTLRRFYEQRWYALEECEAQGDTVDPEDWDLARLALQITGGAGTVRVLKNLAHLWDRLQGRLETLPLLTDVVVRPKEHESVEHHCIVKRTTRRKQRVKAYCDEHGLNREGFCTRVGVSDTAVRALIADRPGRTGPGAKRKLLRVLGMSSEEWDRL
jgi:hypothetical protein